MNCFELRNGLKVVTDSTARHEAFQLTTVVRAGSVFDPEGKAGTAHLTEHLSVVGSVLPPGTIAGSGGETRANTHRDYLIFETRGPAALLPAVLDAECDRLGGQLHVSAELFGAQKAGVVDEVDTYFRSGRPWATISDLVFGDWGPSHDSFGDPEQTRTLTLDECSRFARRCFRPERAAMALRGDLSAVGGVYGVRTHLDGRFGRPRPAEPVGSAADRTEIRSPHAIVSTAIKRPWAAWLVPGIAGDSLRRLAMEIVAVVLRERRQLIASVGRSPEAHSALPEAFAIAPVADDDLAACISVAREPIGAREFADAVAILSSTAAWLSGDAAATARLWLVSGTSGMAGELHHHLDRLDVAEVVTIQQELLGCKPWEIRPQTLDLPSQPADRPPAPKPYRPRRAGAGQQANHAVSPHADRISAAHGVVAQPGPGQNALVIVLPSDAPHLPARPWYQQDDARRARYVRVSYRDELPDDVRCDLAEALDGVAGPRPLAVSAVGPEARHWFDIAAPGRKPAIRDPEVVRQAAARWVGAAFLNGADRIRRGGIPQPVIVPAWSRDRYQVVGTRPESRPIDGQRLEDVRSFVIGGLLTQQLSAPEEAHALTKLLALDVHTTVSDFCAVLADLTVGEVDTALRQLEDLFARAEVK
ncbi:M16 family metallopeptidase [Nocardia sp. CA-290969]|uniref:M16 family metallopeptidase n=1 Tax=Nocardia sp. CA-290969 TaxID=3239986 RepID=UPI003D8A9981